MELMIYGCARIIRTRTSEGRERAKARGVKNVPQAEAHPASEAGNFRRKENGEVLREIAQSYNVHNGTISRLEG
jgi:DNA invertase Pin-like site-specific DNA recombinase